MERNREPSGNELAFDQLKLGIRQVLPFNAQGLFLGNHITDHVPRQRPSGAGRPDDLICHT